MKTLLIIAASMMLAACASSPIAYQPEPIFRDQLFPAATVEIKAENIFAMSVEMQQYLQKDLDEQVRLKGSQQGLYDALYMKSQLKIDYDSARTRTASQAFEARSGNCLSMAIMTAAFAKALNLHVEYHSVAVEETWSRSGNTHFSAGHVNVSLREKQRSIGDFAGGRRSFTIDFIPIADLRHHMIDPISEETIIAMFMNNRAAESLADGDIANAYWWARAAIEQDSNFLNSYNTLGVIYQRHGDFHEAANVLSYLITRDTEHISGMFNLAQVMKRLGRDTEAQILTAKVEKARPYPPFYFFDLGQAAMKRGDYKTARDMFSKEVARAPEYHEFNFWLASAYYKLGEIKPAERYMALAVENSTTPKDHALYAAKLDKLQFSARREQ